MSSKRKVNTVKSTERCSDMTSDSETTNIVDNDLDVFNNDVFDDSDGSDIMYPIIEHLVSENDTDDEEDISLQLSEQWIWQVKNNQPTVWNYTETPGIRVTTLGQLDESSGKLDFFNTIFDNMFWEIIVMETNRYAEQLLSDENKVRKIDETWVPVHCDEIKLFFALCIIMSQVKKPKIQMHWSKKAVIETPIFRKTMPLLRFLQITRFLHFTNNDIVDNTDRLHKIKPIINFFNHKFKEVYTMEEDIAIDESLMKFKGRMSYKQYNSSNRARFGIKIYKLCESASGYCHHFKIYTGNDKINPDDSAFEDVVMELSQSVLHKGHTLYLDNLYASPQLFLTLITNKTNAIGTVRSNRRNMPRDFVKTKLKKGECKMRSSNGILALKWKDVSIISTKHKTAEITEHGENQYNRILKPKCIIEYNKGMIGANLQDQMLACFPIMRKYMKGFRKIFFYAFDMALFNTYILYRKINKENEQSYCEFRIDIAELLLKTIQLPDYKIRGRISNEDTPLRLQAQHWSHFPKHIDPTPTKQKPSRACKVCSKHKKRSETTWECKRCRVALHIPHCFERYHTIDDY